MTIKKLITLTFVSTLLSLGTMTTALADALDDAKDAGYVGEQADGYLGVVSASAPAAAAALVADINAKRRAEYTRIATKNGITLKQVEALAGKKAVERTHAGDWVKIGGGWQQK